MGKIIKDYIGWDFRMWLLAVLWSSCVFSKENGILLGQNSGNNDKVTIRLGSIV